MTSITVEDDAVQELRDAIYAQRGHLYGHLKREASQALRDRARQLAADTDEAEHGKKQEARDG